METLVFDVMLDGKFIKTFRYKYHPIFPLGETELYDFVVSKIPSLRGKDFKIYFC